MDLGASEDATVPVPAQNDSINQQVTKNSWMATLVAGMGMGFDAYVINLPVIMLPVMAAFYHVNAASLAAVQAIFMFGYFFGTMGFGVIADYLGRRFTLGASILGFSITTALNGLAPTLSLFALGRFVTGVLGGGEQGLGSVYACEAWPDKWRGWGTGNMFSFYPLGVMMTIGALMFIVPYYGWQGAFYLTLVIGIIIFAVRMWIMESGRFAWTRQQVKQDKIHRSFSMQEIFQNRSLRRPWLSTLLINLGDNFNYHGISVIALIWLRQTFHLAPAIFFPVILLLYAIQFGECVLGSYLLDIIGRRPMGIICSLAIAIGVPLLSFQTNLTTAIMVAAFSWCIALGPAWSTKLTLTPEVFPTEFRGTGIAMTLGFGRLTAVLAPAVEAFLLLEFGVNRALWVFLISGLVALVGYLLAPELRRKPIADLMPAA